MSSALLIKAKLLYYSNEHVLLTVIIILIIFRLLKTKYKEGFLSFRPRVFLLTLSTFPYSEQNFWDFFSITFRFYCVHFHEIYFSFWTCHGLVDRPPGESIACHRIVSRRTSKSRWQCREDKTKSKKSSKCYLYSGGDTCSTILVFLFLYSLCSTGFHKTFGYIQSRKEKYSNQNRRTALMFCKMGWCIFFSTASSILFSNCSKVNSSHFLFLIIPKVFTSFRCR